MSAILKFDFQKKRKQLRFSEVNYLNYTKKDQILHVATTCSLKQGKTRTNHGPIPHPLITCAVNCLKKETKKQNNSKRLVIVWSNAMDNQLVYFKFYLGLCDW